jgi:hypothetical protein
MQVIHPPGDYGDGPVYLRVHRAKAGESWPRPGYSKEVNDWRLEMDPVYDYVKAHNSQSAFAYCQWLMREGVPGEALGVVRASS